MQPFDSTHFCKKCGQIAVRQLGEESFWCSECQELVSSVTSIPELNKIKYKIILSNNSKS